MNTRRKLREPLDPRPAAPAALGALLVLCAGTLVGCASTHRTGPTPSGELAITGRPALSRLRALAASEKSKPTDAPLPPGIDPRAFTPAGPAASDAKAALPLKAALEEIAVGPKPDFLSAPVTPAPAADRDRLHQALRLYANARDQRKGGLPAAAVTDLEAAAQLDPASPEIQTELAESLLATGKRLAASTALQKAAALGSPSARVYWLLAIDAVRSNNAKDAAWLLAKAKSLQPEHQDSALPYLIDAGLAEALSNLGYTAASTAQLEIALDLPEQLSSQTIYRQEYSELLRRQADGARDLGDSHARTGDFDAAARMYDRAAELPTLDPGAILARRVYARIRSGRPAGAALVIASAIEESGGMVEERQISLISSLIAKTPAAQPLASAISEVEQVAGADLPPRARSGLMRAVAAASSTSAQAPLKTLLARVPDDRDAMRDLLNVRDSDARLAPVFELLATSTDPHALAENAAESLVDSGRGISSALTLLAKRQDDAAVIVQSQILLSLGMPVTALDRAAGRTWTPTYAIAGSETVARAAAIAGNWPLYQTAIASLDARGPAAALARTRALLIGQRFKDAYAASTQVPRDKQTGVGTLLTLARAAQLAGKVPEAGAILESAIQNDRFDERGYEGMFSLYAPSGVQSDNDKLTTAIRSLRQNIPSSRLIRWITAQDLVQRGSIPQAERALLALAEEDPAAPKLVDVLSSLWERAPKSAQVDAEAWLRSHLADRPESVPLRSALARLLARSSRTDEALSTCDLLFAGRTPPELLRTRERILREGGKADAADASAKELAALTGVGIEASIELAESTAAAGSPGNAAAILDRGVPAGVDLATDQITRIAGIVSSACQSKSESLTPADLGALVDFALSRQIVLPPQTHEAHIRRIGAMPQVTFDQLGHAALAATKQYPTLSEVAFRRAAQSLIDAGAKDRAAAFLVSQLHNIPDIKEDLITDTFALTATSGDAACVNALIDAMDKGDWIDAIIMKMEVADALPEELDQKRVELAYTLGVVLNQAGRDQLAEVAYRRALAMNPDHPWANNNLGYQIAENHGDLTEAEAMLRRAAASLPEDGSVLDSLGWILYKQGKLQDQPGAGGKPQPGAISLLGRATTSMKGSENPTILDHYADVLWVTGNHDKAREYWTKARTAVKGQIQMLRLSNANSQPPPETTRLETLSALIAAKLEAANAGREPAIGELPGAQNH